MDNIKKLVKNPFIQKWFLILLCFVTVLFMCFAIYTHIHSSELVRTEFTAYSELQTERISAHLDDCFQSYNRVGALLALDDMVNIYLFQENANVVFPDLYTQIYSQMTAYTQGFPAIDSVYLYPSYQGEIFSSGYVQPIPLDSLTDNNWLPHSKSLESPTWIYREKNNHYPFLATLLIPVQQSGREALIVVNINIYNISILGGKNSNSFQNIYIVSNDGEVLYRTFQKSMPEPLNKIDGLIHFDGAVESQGIFVDDSYVFVQQQSAKYPWHYITITTPQAFSARSFNFLGSLWTFLPWLFVIALVIIISLALMITHPLRTITEFLDAPITQLPDKISEPEVQKIIRQFINYVHTNESLSDELNHQMELQNNATYCALQAQINPHFLFNTLNMIRNMEIESLGYDHEVPDMTLTLSKLLRYAISSTELVSLDTEFYHMDMYVKILNQRYQNMLQFNISKGQNCSDIMIPKMILQPLVENAAFHGCSPTLSSNNQIFIDAQKHNNRCVITVRDDGIGIGAEELEKLRATLEDRANIPRDSIGLKNVVCRMHLTYGKEFLFSIDSMIGEGTTITLSFPT